MKIKITMKDDSAVVVTDANSIDISGPTLVTVLRENESKRRVFEKKDILIIIISEL